MVISLLWSFPPRSMRDSQFQIITSLKLILKTQTSSYNYKKSMRKCLLIKLAKTKPNQLQPLKILNLLIINHNSLGHHNHKRLGDKSPDQPKIIRVNYLLQIQAQILDPDLLPINHRHIQHPKITIVPLIIMLLIKIHPHSQIISHLARKVINQGQTHFYQEAIIRTSLYLVIKTAACGHLAEEHQVEDKETIS